jgi:hypothetical protein
MDDSTPAGQFKTPEAQIGQARLRSHRLGQGPSSCQYVGCGVVRFPPQSWVDDQEGRALRLEMQSPFALAAILILCLIWTLGI